MHRMFQNCYAFGLAPMSQIGAESAVPSVSPVSTLRYGMDTPCTSRTPNLDLTEPLFRSQVPPARPKTGNGDSYKAGRNENFSF